MNKGKTLTQLAVEIERRQEAKVDYVVDTRELEFLQIGEEENKTFALNVPGQGYYGIADHAHHQLANKLGIPMPYYRRMMSQAPELLTDNVAHWLHDGDDKRMIRTLDQNVRAVLSNRYKRIENEDILQAALPAIEEQKDAIILSTEVTDLKMYVKVLFPSLEQEIKTGDTVRPGVVISNSEVGAGSLNVQAFFYRDFCTNGCVFGQGDLFGLKKTHLGRAISVDDFEVYRDDTIAAQDQATLLQIRDVVSVASSEDMFNKMVNKLRQSTEGPQIENPEAAVQVLAKAVGLNETERGQALINLIEDRDMTRWGALNAVTKIANESESYDRSSELESLGGKILELSMREWGTIAQAVAA